jgi:UDPglucose--hexose-1-phosphate uridylyltransferase
MSQVHSDEEGASGRLVWNPLTGVYLVQSPSRMERREAAGDCPFCADLTSGRILPGTQVWARPNDFPAFRPPVGECLILIYSADHQRTFADLTPDEALAVVGLWQQVYEELSQRYACVMTWETCGEAIGQTQRHPHGQTFGVAVVPPVLARELASVERADADGAGCPFCQVLVEEESGPRVVASLERWLAFVPPYARYPYEVHIFPRRHISAIGALEPGGEAARELAVLLPRVVRAYNRIFGAPMPYMLGVHQLADERFHLHLELLPVGRAPGKLKLAASSEMSWGLWLNDALPEVKAAELCAALAQEVASEGAVHAVP